MARKLALFVVEDIRDQIERPGEWMVHRDGIQVIVLSIKHNRWCRFDVVPHRFH